MKSFTIKKRRLWRSEVATNSNYIVKVTDAKLPEIQKALEQAGIKVRSIIEVLKEDVSTEKAGDGS
jgi:hypothetical protein